MTLNKVLIQSIKLGDCLIHDNVIYVVIKCVKSDEHPVGGLAFDIQFLRTENKETTYLIKETFWSRESIPTLFGWRQLNGCKN
jgi:hypothetical protein